MGPLQLAKVNQLAAVVPVARDGLVVALFSLLALTYVIISHQAHTILKSD